MTDDASKNNEMRYERKSLISHLSKSEVEEIIKLHPALFSEIFHERYVNNIYFDTINLSSYKENLGGISERTKVRIRWYGDIFGVIKEPVLEFKIKKGFLGYKLRYPLESFSLDEKYSLELQEQLFRKADIPPLLKTQLIQLHFAVLNHYARKYFQSADGKFRITIDSDMNYYRIDPADNHFMEKITDSNVVLELKYSAEHDEEARYITNHLPTRLTKSSKFATGIERLHLITF